jgi:AcrR family transcriptional regulator
VRDAGVNALPAADAPTTRSALTRAKLLSVAERLFAERSIAGVSLNEISKAAGQRNSNACQYHFGDKAGLVQAILDKHVPGIKRRREQILDRLRASGRVTLRALVQAFVRPVAEKLEDPDGGREFIRINAQLIALHTLSVQGVRRSPLRLARADRFSRTLLEAVAERVPGPIARERLMLAAVLVFHGFDDHTRMLDASSRRAARAVSAPFVANLEDAVLGLLLAPVSARARALQAPSRAA